MIKIKRCQKSNQNIVSHLHLSILTFIARVVARTLRSNPSNPLCALWIRSNHPLGWVKNAARPTFLRYAVEPYSAELLNEMIGAIVQVCVPVKKAEWLHPSVHESQSTSVKIHQKNLLNLNIYIFFISTK